MSGVAGREPDTLTARGPEQIERRRPGRIENASPALIPLLRSSHKAADDKMLVVTSEELPRGEWASDPSSVRGVALGATVGILFWCLIVGCIWLLPH